jgi:hypothetical protein
MVPARLIATASVLLLIAGIVFASEYNIPFGRRGGTDFTADIGSGQSCLGAWLIFDDATEATSELDRCTGATNQDGTNDMVWAGSNWGSSTAPTGTSPGYDSADITADTSEWYALADDNDFEADGFTIGCWVNKDAGDSVAVIGKNDASDYQIDVYDNGTVWAEVRNAVETTATGAITNGSWSHVALRYNSGDDSIEPFVDGLTACSGACNTNLAPQGNADELRIGAAEDGAQEYSGKLMECFYFNTELTDTEIAEIFLCGLRGDADGAARDAAYSGAQCSAINTCC